MPVASGGESEFTVEQLSGLGDWMSDLFGKPQAWYDRIGRDQAEISALLAEVNAIGSTLWNEMQGRIAGAIQAGAYVPVDRFTDFNWTQDDLLEQAKLLLITKSQTPSDQQIATAESRIKLYRAMVEYAKSILPEIALQVQDEGDRQRAAVNAMSLRSPAEVGVETFKQELERRASALGSGLGVGAIVAVVAAAFAFAWWSKR